MKAIYAFALAILMLSCNEAEEGTTMAENDAAATTTAMSIEIPQAVSNAFSSSYTNATDVEWEMEGDKYEVTFEQGDDEMSILYNADGSMYATETEIDITELPKAVNNAVNGSATEVCKVVMADGTTSYEVEVGDKEYTYSENGVLISEQASDDEGEDDSDNEEDED